MRLPRCHGLKSGKVTLRDMNPKGGTLIKSDRLEGGWQDIGGLSSATAEASLHATSGNHAPAAGVPRQNRHARQSEVVRLARADAERKTANAPAIRVLHERNLQGFARR